MASDVLRVVDLVLLARRASERGAAWSVTTEDLNVNLVVLGVGDEIGEHVNSEVDVLLVGVGGDGEVVVDGVSHRVEALRAIALPKGSRRAVRSMAERFSYLTCHRSRPGLRPAVPD